MYTIYISGPVTNVVGARKNFKKAEKALKSQFPNARIINPSAMADVLIGSKWGYEDFMEFDLELLSICSHIYMLKGWENSCGSNREYGYALANNLTILKEMS